MAHDTMQILSVTEGGHEVVAAIFVPRRPENFLGTVQRLTEECRIPVVLGAPKKAMLGPLNDLGLDCIETWSAATLVNDLWIATRANVLVVTDAVLVPPDFLAVGLELLQGDLRVATVSFLSNAASFLSFPHRNQPVERPVEGHDEVSVTRRLRLSAPVDGPVPIPMATGAAVLLSSVALGAVGLLENARSGIFAAALADFSFRGRQRGFVDLLDARTFYARPSDISVEVPAETVGTGLTLDDNGWLHERHPMAHAFVDSERASADSPLALALSTARAKVVGVRVLVDGSCLGGQEMGTQVTTVALIEALAARADVREVCVALPGPIPNYAQRVLTHPKVRAEPLVGGHLSPFGRVDIAHRPFQPNEGFSVEEWREVADRIVVTVHDLISFHVGAYSGDTGVWLRYRQTLRDSLARVDGVVVVSDDVRQQVELHRLPVDANRVFVIPNGTEHLTGAEKARMPEELLARGFVAGEFLLCLGTNYTHKNRDLALRTFGELRRRGRDLALVMAGAGVPWGSSRVLEAASGERDQVIVLPDVASDERNWLLRHASLVIYPTSAEGFGLVPYEAARFGTATVHVGFGPLAEIGGELPVVARDWSPEALADAAEALLADPSLAARQVASCLETGAGYTWARAAATLTDTYRMLLARPPA
jgi:glycosyltransferase involved in cell wall biosynthesis